MSTKAGVPQSIRRVLFRESGYRCVACGIVGREVRCKGGFIYPTDTPLVYLSVDHIKPRSAGGTSDRSNLRVLCTRCNTGKGVKPEGRWTPARTPILGGRRGRR